MKDQARVVVIGGGVVGASVLYHLTKLGWTDVMLLERSDLTSGSTWHAAGGMHTINGDPNVAKLQQYTIELYKEIEVTLRRNGTYEDKLRGETLASQIHEGFKDKEAEKLRGQYIQLNMFNENWIPAIKNGHYHRFELYNLAKDPSQKKNIAKAHPEVFNRLKNELLKINASVMADGPDWHLK